MSDSPKVTSIVIRFDDGSRLESHDAANAEEVWRWWMGAETMSVIHGGQYRGRALKTVEANDERREAVDA